MTETFEQFIDRQRTFLLCRLLHDVEEGTALCWVLDKQKRAWAYDPKVFCVLDWWLLA